MPQQEVTLPWINSREDYFTPPLTIPIPGLPGGMKPEASAATACRGDHRLMNPEVGFVGALSGCCMLTPLALTYVQKLVADTCEDHASGTLAGN